MQKIIELNTSKKRELVDITQPVEEFVQNSNVKDGICVVYVPHATGALIVNENEAGLKEDILNFIEKLVPKNQYLHNRIDDNAEAHIVSSIIGTEKTFIIEKGELIRGTWQNIFFVELDGPRKNRQVAIKVIKL